MTAEHLDSDRFTAVSGGESRWTGAESAHIDRCPACRLEWQLVRASRSLGSRESAEIDAARAAGIVLQRLVSEPAEPARRWTRRAGWMLAAGAAALLALAVLLPGGAPAPAPSPPAAAMTVLHELDDLTPAELEAVLETIPPTAEEAPHVEAAPLGELSVPDLERMLRAME
jgi:hypothetical protein